MICYSGDEIACIKCFLAECIIYFSSLYKGSTNQKIMCGSIIIMYKSACCWSPVICKWDFCFLRHSYIIWNHMTCRFAEYVNSTVSNLHPIHCTRQRKVQVELDFTTIPAFLIVFFVLWMVLKPRRPKPKINWGAFGGCKCSSVT